MPGKRQTKDKSQIEWDFYSFPVWYAAAIGALIATLLALTPLFLAVFVISLFGTAFGTTHVIGQTVRKRRIAREKDRAQEAELERRAYVRMQRKETSQSRAESAEDDTSTELQPHQTPHRRRRRR